MLNRNHLVDLIRGIAILLVVVGHALFMDLNSLTYPLIQVIYSFHVPLFFIIAGFVTAYKTTLDLKWTLKRVACLMLPYYSYGIFVFLFSFHLGNGADGFIKFKGFDDLLNYLISPVGDGGLKGLWFLVALAWCYPLIFIVNKFRTSFFLMCTTAVIMVVATALLTTIFKTYNFLGLNSIVSYFPFFFSGYLFNIFKNKFAFLDKMAILLPLSISSLVFISFSATNIQLKSLINPQSFLDIETMAHLVIRVAQVIAGSVFVYVVAKLLISVPKVNSFLVLTGRNTLAIYCIHGFILTLVAGIIPILAIFALVTIILSWLWALFVEKFTVTRVLFAGHWNN